MKKKMEIAVTMSWLFIGAAAAGCGVEGTAPADDTDDTAAVASELGSTATEQPLSPHGGGGGVFNGHVTPPAIIYGLQVNSGSFVDRITFFYYQPTRPDNRYAGEALFAVAFGGGGGASNPSFVCPANQSIIGLRGAAGSFVDRIGVVCSDVTFPNPFSPANGFSPVWGGPGGAFFDDRCSVGRIVDSFNVRAGSFVDNLQAICVNAL